MAIRARLVGTCDGEHPCTLALRETTVLTTTCFSLISLLVSDGPSDGKTREKPLAHVSDMAWDMAIRAAANAGRITKEQLELVVFYLRRDTELAADDERLGEAGYFQQPRGDLQVNSCAMRGHRYCHCSAAAARRASHIDDGNTGCGGTVRQHLPGRRRGTVTRCASARLRRRPAARLCAGCSLSSIRTRTSTCAGCSGLDGKCGL